MIQPSPSKRIAELEAENAALKEDLLVANAIIAARVETEVETERAAKRWHLLREVLAEMLK